MIYANPVQSPMMFAPPQVSGLPVDVQSDLDDMVTVWSRKRPRNVTRQLYVDAKELVKNLNISVSQDIADLLEITSGWGEKAVYGLSNLCQWDGVVSPDGVDDPFDLDVLLHANRFDVELPQVIASEMTHSVAFISTTPGDVASGEPPVVLMPHSAEWASAIWDRRTRSLRCALTINDVDPLGRPTHLTVFTPFEVTECVNRGLGWFIATRQKVNLGRVPVEAMPFRPTLDRPFGRSRVSRSVMNIIDRAVRASLRMDVSSELFTVPGILLRGITPEAWDDISKSWSWRLGSVKGVTRDANDNVPEVTTLPQQSMQPFMQQMQELAAEFSGATSIPINQLGIVQDNPSSAEAIYAAKEELVIEATNANRVNGYALNRIYQNLVLLRDGGEVTDELSRISTRWRNPSMPSVVSQSDAMVKQISAIPGLADTDVALEELGYSDEQIKRIRSQIKSSQASGLVREALARSRQPQEVTAGGDSGGGGTVPGGQQPGDGAGGGRPGGTVPLP